MDLDDFVLNIAGTDSSVALGRPPKKKERSGNKWERRQQRVAETQARSWRCLH